MLYINVYFYSGWYLCTLQGGTVQVRFQPNVGQLLAAAAENVVSIFDVETDRKKHTWQVFFYQRLVDFSIVITFIEMSNSRILIFVVYDNHHLCLFAASQKGCAICLLGQHWRTPGIC